MPVRERVRRRGRSGGVRPRLAAGPISPRGRPGAVGERASEVGAGRLREWLPDGGVGGRERGAFAPQKVPEQGVADQRVVAVRREGREIAECVRPERRDHGLEAAAVLSDVVEGDEARGEAARAASDEAPEAWTRAST